MDAQDLQDRLRDDRDDGQVGHEPSPLDDTTPIPPIPTAGRRRRVRARRWAEASIIGPIAGTRLASWLSARVRSPRGPRQWIWVAAGVIALALFLVLLVTLPGQGQRSRASSSTSPAVAFPPPVKAVPDRPVPSTAPPAPAVLGPTAPRPLPPRPVAPRAAEAAGSLAPPSTRACSSQESGSVERAAAGGHHGHRHESPCPAREVSGAQGDEQ
jgi:hypothetical protein